MRKVFKCLLIICLIMITCGCVTNYKRRDIIKYVKENIGIRHFDVSRTYQVIEDDEGYENKYWKVYDKDNDIMFYVKDDYYYSSEMTNNRLINNYYSMYYVKYESKLNINNNLKYEELDSEGPDIEITLSCSYENKKELDKCFNSMKYVSNYFNGKSDIYYAIKYNFAGRDDDANVKYLADYSGNTYKISEDDTSYYNYFYYGINFDVDSIISEMNITDYNSVINNRDNYKVVQADSNRNTIKEYDNMFCSSSYTISYNTLYNVLKEEGYNVVGDNHDYKVYYNNIVYEFSDDFVEYSISKNYDVYYYKKNGEKIYAYYGHDWERVLSPRDINEIFGLQLDCDWQKN